MINIYDMYVKQKHNNTHQLCPDCDRGGVDQRALHKNVC
jgi:hypothetical protein